MVSLAYPPSPAVAIRFSAFAKALAGHVRLSFEATWRLSILIVWVIMMIDIITVQTITVRGKPRVFREGGQIEVLEDE